MTSRTRPDSSDSSNKRTIQPDGSIRVTVQGANHAECTAAGGFQDDSTCLDLESTLEDVADQAAMFTSSITSREHFDGVVVTDAATAMQAMYSTHTPYGHGDTDYVNSSGGHFSLMHSDMGSPYSTDAPAFPDMQYHGRPASRLTNASVSGPSAAMSTADQQGSSHLDGSRQVQLAHEEMGAEISNLLIILGEDEAASLGADWNQIVTTNGASLTVAAPSADQEAVERPPQLLALLLRTVLTLRQALEAQLLSNCVSLAKYHLSPELNEFRQVMLNRVMEQVPVREMYCKRFASILRENALSMYFKLHVAHPYVTGDKKRLLANYIGETEKQVAQHFTNYRSRNQCKDEIQLAEGLSRWQNQDEWLAASQPPQPTGQTNMDVDPNETVALMDLLADISYMPV